MLRYIARTAAAAMAGLVITAGAAAAGTSDASTGVNTPAATQPAAVAMLSPKEAGARYGQALGAVEICIGSKVTDKAKALGEPFKDAELEDYKKQAAKVYDAWLKVKGCSRQVDPNQCKIIMDKSCEAAEAEIGPTGKVMPGLVEFLKR